MKQIFEDGLEPCSCGHTVAVYRQENGERFFIWHYSIYPKLCKEKPKENREDSYGTEEIKN